MTTSNKFGDYLLAARDTTETHGIKPPNTSDENLLNQFHEAFRLNEDAKTPGWTNRTKALLWKYSPLSQDCGVTYPEAVVEVFGEGWDWKRLTEFVQTDTATDFFNVCIKYLNREGETYNTRKKGFVDVTKTGIQVDFIKDLDKFCDKIFDAKAAFALERPLEWMWKRSQVDFSLTANKVHPDFHTYPAGHGGVAAFTVYWLKKIFNIGNIARESKCLILAASAFSMARSGSLIHYPMDNHAAWELAELEA